MNKSFILKMTKVCGFLFGVGAGREGVISAALRTSGGSGIWKARAGLFPLVNGSILPQVLPSKRYFQIMLQLQGGFQGLCIKNCQDPAGALLALLQTQELRRVMSLSSKGDVRF